MSKVKPIQRSAPDHNGYITITVHKDNLQAINIMATRAWHNEAGGLDPELERRIHALAYHMMNELN